jgi:hypothetical protein
MALWDLPLECTTAIPIDPNKYRRNIIEVLVEARYAFHIRVFLPDLTGFSRKFVSQGIEI